MKKALTIISMILILVTLTACSGTTPQTTAAAQPTTNQPAANTAVPASEAAPQTSAPAEALSYPAQAGESSSQAAATGPNSYPAQGQTSTTEQPSIILQPGEVPAAPADAPVPDAGKASVSGTLFSFAGRRIFAGTAFYLTPATGKDKNEPQHVLTGPNKDNGDINSWADEKGQFSINNIPPGNYYLVVAAPMDWIVVEKSKDDAAPLMIELKADQRLALGVVQVPY